MSSPASPAPATQGASSAPGAPKTCTSALPTFADIGKKARDLFDKNFFFDIINLKMQNGLNSQMCYEATQKFLLKEQKMLGECELRYYNWNTIFKPKFNTDSIITGEIRVDRPEFKGASLVLNGTYNVPTGQKLHLIGATFRAEDYTVEIANVQNDPDLKPNGGLIKCTGVVNLWGWIFGGCIFSDLGEAKFAKTQLIGGFQDPRTSFFVSCNPSNKQVTGSIYNNINSKVQTALIYSMGKDSKSPRTPDGSKSSNAPTLGFAASYQLNPGAKVKVRINSEYLLGLSYVMKLKPGFVLTMCTEVDAGKLKQGGHKIGFGLEMN